jgi:putative NADPH-quinone reductase
MPNATSPKRIFVLNGHPAESSLSKSIVETYADSARIAGHDIRILHLNDISFDADYGFSGYTTHKPLEPALKKFQENVEWAEHIVMSTPMWWGSLPAKLKGVFDRALLPGWAFDTRTTKMGMPAPMLTGRTARVFVTSDTPDFFFGLMYRKALLRQIKGQIFGFVGIKPTKFTHFSPASKASTAKVEVLMKTVSALAKKGV